MSTDRVFVLSGDEVDVLLVLLHPGDVVLERARLLAAAAREETQQFGQLLAIHLILVDAQLRKANAHNALHLRSSDLAN